MRSRAASSSTTTTTIAPSRKTKHLRERKRDTEAPRKTSTASPIKEEANPNVVGHVCTICSKSFSYSNDLRKHLRIHSNERPFGCDQCDMRFRQAGCLKNHVACQHGSAVSFICYYCTKAFPIKERLRLHMRIHSGEKPYKCEYCDKGFSRGGQIAQHLATYNACKKKHLALMLGSNSNKKLRKMSSDLTDRTKCQFCGKTFQRKRMMKGHLDVCAMRLPETTFYCGVCKHDVTGYPTMHAKLHHEHKTSLTCTDCGSTFAQLSQLKVHNRVHSGERPYKCQVCWQSFAHSSVLKLHIRKHTGEKPFRCTVCPDTWFSQLPHLKTHMRAIHGMDKTYQCHTCQDFFKTKNEHMLHSASCSPSTGGDQRSSTTSSSTTTLNSLPKIPKSDGAIVADSPSPALSQMRLHIAVLLKRISSQERLKQLGFEKILIDNVILGALKKAGRPYECESTMPVIDRFRRNIRHFLEWTVPKSMLNKFGHSDDFLEANVDQLLIDLTAKLAD